MTIARLPLSPDVSQSFACQLSSRKLFFVVNFNERSNQWSMSIADDTTGAVLASGIALVLGQELLSPFNLGIGAMIVYDESRSSTDAKIDDLGTRVNVYWFSEDEYK